LGTSTTITGGGGGIDGVAITSDGKYYLTTTDDGHYEVGSVSGTTLGTPTAYLSTCDTTYGALPTGTATFVNTVTNTDYGYVDCSGAQAALIDAFNFTTPGTITENGPLSALGGTAIYDSYSMGISVDGHLMDILGTFSGSVETANVSNVSGVTVTDAGCPTGNLSLPGYGSTWTYGTIDVLGSSLTMSGGAVVTEGSFGLTTSSYEQELVNSNSNSHPCLSLYRTQGSNNGASDLALSGASFFTP